MSKQGWIQDGLAMYMVWLLYTEFGGYASCTATPVHNLPTYISSSQDPKCFLGQWGDRGPSKTSYQQLAKEPVVLLTLYSGPLFLLYNPSTRGEPSRVWNIWRGNGGVYVLFIYCWSSCDKLIHTAIDVWRGKLGVHWDNKDGCGIMPEERKSGKNILKEG